MGKVTTELCSGSSPVEAAYRLYLWWSQCSIVSERKNLSRQAFFTGDKYIIIVVVIYYLAKRAYLGIVLEQWVLNMKGDRMPRSAI